MKSNVVPVSPVESPLTVLPTAKIVRHPRSKKSKDEDSRMTPPDEETVSRLNAMARQYPFCVHHKGTNRHLL